MSDSAVEFDLLVDPSDIDLEARFSQMAEPVRFAGRVKKEDWLVHLKASAETSVKRKCDRCLDSRIITVKISCDSAYVNFAGLNEDRETDLEIKGLDYSVMEGHELDLKRVFGEQLLLSIPDRFVCSDACRGICPECGEKMNTANCKCEDSMSDPRWSALKEIKRGLEKESN